MSSSSQAHFIVEEDLTLLGGLLERKQYASSHSAEPALHSVNVLNARQRAEPTHLFWHHDARTEGSFGILGCPSDCWNVMYTALLKLAEHAPDFTFQDSGLLRDSTQLPWPNPSAGAVAMYALHCLSTAHRFLQSFTAWTFFIVNAAPLNKPPHLPVFLHTSHL